MSEATDIKLSRHWYDSGKKTIDFLKYLEENREFMGSRFDKDLQKKDFSNHLYQFFTDNHWGDDFDSWDEVKEFFESASALVNSWAKENRLIECTYEHVATDEDGVDFEFNFWIEVRKNP